MPAQANFVIAFKTLLAFILLAAQALACAMVAVPPLVWTAAEAAFIARAEPIKMCVDPDWAPFERINAQGQHEGIAAELVQLVAQRVGLQLELLPTKNWDESLAASKAKRCQVMSFLNRTPVRDTWLIFTSPIFFDPNVIITREEHGFIADLKALQGERVVLPHGTMVEEQVRRDFPNLTVVLSGSEPESMQMVSERQADLTIRSLIVAADAIKREGLFNLKISGQVPQYTNELRMGVSKDQPELRAILDKGIKTITLHEREAISNKYTAVNIQQGIDWTRVYVLLVLLATAIMVALYILRKNHQLQAALAASHEARDALRVSEERHRLLADNASDIIWTMDLNGRNTYISPSVERLRGYTVSEAMQQSLQEALTPASAQIAQAGLDRALEAIQANRQVPAFRAELEQPCKSGGTIWTEVSFSGIHNAEGEFVNFLGVTRDISERKRAELDLHIAAIAFESQDGMIVTDAQSKILRVNHAFTKISGYAAIEVIGKTPRMLQSGRHDADFYAAMWGTIHQVGVWQGEIWNRRKSGEVYPEQITITAVKDSQAQVTHYVAVLEDITQRKQLEKEVAQLAFFDTLTQLPNRRLFNDRLGQSLIRAQRTQSTLALMFIDLDKFKPINDTHGHEAGDHLLQTLAQRIEGCLRASDTAARVGGDEFLVLLSDLQASQDARAVAEKIRQALEQPVVTATGAVLCASASIGIALYPEHGQTAQDLLRAGDQAMYQAKNRGGNAIELWTAPDKS